MEVHSKGICVTTGSKEVQQGKQLDCFADYSDLERILYKVWPRKFQPSLKKLLGSACASNRAPTVLQAYHPPAILLQTDHAASAPPRPTRTQHRFIAPHSAHSGARMFTESISPAEPTPPSFQTAELGGVGGVGVPPPPRRAANDALTVAANNPPKTLRPQPCGPAASRQLRPPATPPHPALRGAGASWPTMVWGEPDRVS